jgi:hypothetical protein
VECEGQRPDAARLAQLIDSDLQRGNEDYSVHRSSALSLAVPHVTLLPRGAFEKFMRSRNKLGGQHKVPRVLEDPALIAQLNAYARDTMDMESTVA